MSACAICGAEPCQGHHLTGTDADDRNYLDPDFIVPLCHDDHVLVHDDWHTHGLQRAPERLSHLELIELALRRIAVLVGRFAEAHADLTWAGGWAQAFDSMANKLAIDLQARDAR